LRISAPTRNIFPGATDIFLNPRHLIDHHPVFAVFAAFLHHDGIGPSGHRRTGENAGGSAGLQRR
jgi:hypothetical protein